MKIKVKERTFIVSDGRNINFLIEFTSDDRASRIDLAKFEEYIEAYEPDKEIPKAADSELSISDEFAEAIKTKIDKKLSAELTEKIYALAVSLEFFKFIKNIMPKIDEDREKLAKIKELTNEFGQDVNDRQLLEFLFSVKEIVKDY